MFEESLFESAGGIKSKRGWMALVSFMAQMLFVAILVMMPFIYTEALPRLKFFGSLQQPPAPGPRSPKAARHNNITTPRNTIRTQVLLAPRVIPDRVPDTSAVIAEEDAPQATGGDANRGPGGTEGGPGGVPGGIGFALSQTPPPPRPPVIKEMSRHKLALSQGVLQGYAISQAKPPYPAIAKLAGVSGAVVLQATISKLGTIENLHAVSGSPLLIPAAVNAVKGWRYRPYLLNGVPVEVDTQITVNFSLAGR